MRIADVLRNKGAAVATIAPETSVTELIAGLAEHNIGAMVVVGPEGLVGIVSERDVVRKLHEQGPELLERPVSDIMTTLVATCTPRDSINSLSALMTTNRVRHIPVLDNGRLAGIVSIGDVVKTRMEELEAEQQQLQAYITQGG
jgi:CBS domain-containing protein